MRSIVAASKRSVAYSNASASPSGPGAATRVEAPQSGAVVVADGKHPLEPEARGREGRVEGRILERGRAMTWKTGVQPGSRAGARRCTSRSKGASWWA